jgi:hypothetical protein
LDPPPIGVLPFMRYNKDMGRDHFKQSMFNPYFQSTHYREDSKGGQFEAKVDKLIHKLNIFKRFKKCNSNKES